MYPNKQIWEKDEKPLNILPARDNKYSVVFCVNDKFTQYLGVALKSLIDNFDTDEFLDIVVFTSDLSQSSQEKLQKILTKN